MGKKLWQHQHVKISFINLMKICGEKTVTASTGKNYFHQIDENLWGKTAASTVDNYFPVNQIDEKHRKSAKLP